MKGNYSALRVNFQRVIIKKTTNQAQAGGPSFAITNLKRKYI
jgi:hypothetical protein